MMDESLDEPVVGFAWAGLAVAVLTDVRAGGLSLG